MKKNRFLIVLFTVMLLFVTAFSYGNQIFAEGEDVEETEETFVQEEADLPAETNEEESLPETEEPEDVSIKAASGSAYAILIEDTGDLIFFRSDETYENGSQTVVINGVSYTGMVYTGVENLSANEMFRGNTDIKTIKVAEGHEVRPRNTDHYFMGCTGLVTADLRHFDVTYNGSMRQLFEGCTKLETADLSICSSGIYLYSIAYTERLFYDCSSLKNVVMPASTVNVKNYSYMFYGCSSLESLDLTNLNTEKATNMQDMFGGCTSLASVTLGENISKWLEGGYLPAGTWVNADGLSKTHEELCSGYPDNISEWAGTWTRDLEGKAYAVLKEDGDLVFTRSLLNYANGTSGTLIDRKGDSYTGIIYANVENTPYSEQMPWYYKTYNIKSVYAVDEIHPVNMYDWFYECHNLESFDSKNFDTSQCKSMVQVFYECSSLTSADLSHFDTTNVESFAGMFRSCEKLDTLYLDSFDTTKAWNMEQMFYMCNALEDLDISSFDTANVERLACMFSRCKALTSLDLSHFDTGKAESMYDMFEDCISLKTLDISSFSNAKVTNMSNMFDNCPALYSIKLGSGFANWRDQAYLPAGKWTNASIGKTLTEKELYGQYPENASAYAGTWTKEPEAYAVLKDNGDLVFTRSNNHYANDTYGTLIDASNNEYSGRIFSGIENTGSTPPWLYYMRDIIKVYAADEIHPVTMCGWFDGAKNLEQFQKANIDFANVVSTSEMFEHCESLTALDLKDIDTGSLKNMSWMFSNCTSLSTIDLRGIDTSNVESMSAVFYSCNSLTAVDVSDFDTAKVTDMAYMFLDCEQLTSLDLGNFNTAKVKTMSMMFRGCKKLTDLNISSFDTSNVTSMYAMFYLCESLPSLDLRHFDTAKVEDMEEMFYGCRSATAIDVSSFNTAKITLMDYMFGACNSLETLNLSKFNTAGVTDMHDMFTECYDLKELDLSSFDTGKVESMWGMFYRNDSLTKIKLGKKWTVWLEDGKLPTGTWKNSAKNLTKTETELQQGYPSNATAWAGTWERDFAYAVLKDDGDLIFVRSSNIYENDTAGTLINRYGTEFTGTIYSGIEDEDFYPTWRKADIENAYAVDVIKPKTMAYWFNDCSNLIAFHADYIDTSQCTSFYWLFRYCSSLEQVDLSKFDTANVTSMNCMFAGDVSLKNVNLSNFNTLKVTDMAWMFSDCYSLESLDLSSFDTSKVTSMVNLFADCSSLETIKLGKKWTVWKDDAMLPAGNWHNYSKGLTKTETELQESYPANAADWAGTWTTRDIVYAKPKLVAIYNSANGADIRFDLVDGIETYYLMQKYNGTWKSIKTLKVGTDITKAGEHYKAFDTSIKDSYGKGYIYSIAIKDGEGNLLYNTKGLALYRLKQPTIKSVKSSSKGKATITWSKENCHGYEVQYSLDGKNWTKAPRINSGSTTTQTISGLTSGKKYYFRIRCQKTNADRGTTWSQYSEWSSVKVK